MYNITNTNFPVSIVFQDSAVLSFLQIVITFCTWFIIGIFLYKHIAKEQPKILKSKLATTLLSLNSIEIFLYSIVVFTLIKLLVLIIIKSFILMPLNIESNTFLFSQFFTGENGTTGTGGKLSASAATTAGNSAIMAAGLAGGMTLAKSAPNVTGKVVAVTGSILAGSLGIAAKNISENISKNIGNNLLPNFNVSSLLNLNSQGDDLFNLLSIIHLYQKLSLVFLFFTIYNYIIYKLDLLKIEGYITKNLNVRIATFLIRLLKSNQKFSFILAICFFCLFLISLFSSFYYLDFILTHYDKIKDFYLK